MTSHLSQVKRRQLVTNDSSFACHLSWWLVTNHVTNDLSVNLSQVNLSRSWQMTSHLSQVKCRQLVTNDSSFACHLSWWLVTHHVTNDLTNWLVTNDLSVNLSQVNLSRSWQMTWQIDLWQMTCHIVICHKSICHKSVCHKSICHKSICHKSICHKSICHKSICHKSICHKSICHVISLKWQTNDTSQLTRLVTNDSSFVCHLSWWLVTNHRGRQCRMSTKDKRRVRRGSREHKHTEHTNQFE